MTINIIIGNVNLWNTETYDRVYENKDFKLEIARKIYLINIEWLRVIKYGVLNIGVQLICYENWFKEMGKDVIISKVLFFQSM